MTRRMQLLLPRRLLDDAHDPLGDDTIEKMRMHSLRQSLAVVDVRRSLKQLVRAPHDFPRTPLPILHLQVLLKRLASLKTRTCS